MSTDYYRLLSQTQEDDEEKKRRLQGETSGTSKATDYYRLLNQTGEYVPKEPEPPKETFKDKVNKAKDFVSNLFTKKPEEEKRATQEPLSLASDKIQPISAAKGLKLDPDTGALLKEEDKTSGELYNNLVVAATEAKVDAENKIDGLSREWRELQNKIGNKIFISSDDSAKELELEKSLANYRNIVKDYDEFLSGEQANSGFLREIWNGFTKNSRYNEGWKDLPFSEAYGLIEEIPDKMRAFTKFENGEELSDLEQSIIDRSMSESVNAMLDRGKGYQLGLMFQDMPKYMAEFTMTAGLANMIEAKAASTVSKVTANKFATGLINANIRALGRSPAFLPKIANATAEYALPKYELMAGTDGDLLLEKTGDGDSWGKALAKAGLVNHIEIMSEELGALFPDSTKFLQKSFVGKFLEKRGVSTISQASQSLLAAGWNGPVGEVAEEFVADYLQAPIEGRPVALNPFTPQGQENILVMTLGMSAFAGFAEIPSIAFNTVSNVRTKNGKPVIIDPNIQTTEKLETKDEGWKNVEDRKAFDEALFAEDWGKIKTMLPIVPETYKQRFAEKLSQMPKDVVATPYIKEKQKTPEEINARVAELQKEVIQEKTGVKPVEVEEVSEKTDINVGESSKKEPEEEPEKIEEVKPSGNIQKIDIDKSKYTGITQFSANVKNGVGNMFVEFEPEAQKQGQGTTLVKEVEQKMQDAGAKKITIDSYAESTGFWEKLGYDTVEGYNNKNNLVRMEKNVSQAPVSDIKPKYDGIVPEWGTQDQYYLQNPYRNQLDEMVKTKKYNMNVLKKAETWELEQVLKDKPAFLSDILSKEEITAFAKKNKLWIRSKDGSMVVAKDIDSLNRVLNAIDSKNQRELGLALGYKDITSTPQAPVSDVKQEVPQEVTTTIEESIAYGDEEGSKALYDEFSKEYSLPSYEEMQSSVEEEIINYQKDIEKNIGSKTIEAMYPEVYRDDVKRMVQVLKERGESTNKTGELNREHIPGTEKWMGSDELSDALGKEYESELMDELTELAGVMGGGRSASAIYRSPRTRVGKTAKEVVKEISVPRRQLPVGEGETKVSKLEARVTKVLSNASQEVRDNLGTATFQQMNKKENIAKAVEYVTNNQDEAMRVLEGEVEAPKGILVNSIYVAMENLSKDNSELARRLASLSSTRMGQELSILTEIDPDSPVRKIKEVVKVREAVFKKRHPGKTIKEVNKKLVKSVKSNVEAPSKSDWYAFIDSIDTC